MHKYVAIKTRINGVGKRPMRWNTDLTIQTAHTNNKKITHTQADDATWFRQRSREKYNTLYWSECLLSIRFVPHALLYLSAAIPTCHTNQIHMKISMEYRMTVESRDGFPITTSYPSPWMIWHWWSRKWMETTMVWTLVRRSINLFASFRHHRCECFDSGFPIYTVLFTWLDIWHSTSSNRMEFNIVSGRARNHFFLLPFDRLDFRPSVF